MEQKIKKDKKRVSLILEKQLVNKLQNLQLKKENQEIVRTKNRKIIYLIELALEQIKEIN